MTAKELLLEQLGAVTDQNGWFVSAVSALKGLGATQAARAGGAGSHSVWHVVNHIVFWNERYHLRYLDRPVGKVVSSDATFEGDRVSGTDTQWQAAVEKLVQVMRDWITTLRSADPARLEARITAENPETWYQALANMAIHTAYHLGQVVTLRKEHGDWDPAQGVS